MSCRKLSHNQTRRVERLHGERATRAGSVAIADRDPSAEKSGIVISRFGRQVDIEDPAQPGVIVRCHLRANLDTLVAGDRVAWCAEPGGAVVVAQLERSSLLRRPDAYGKARAVAANLDQILVVIAPEPTPHTNLMDRYLVAAEDAGINALIVLNKIDLLTDPTAFDTLLLPYRSIGFTVLRASAHRAGGLAELRSALNGHLTAVVGQSGVGKSSLLAALLPGESIRVGELSNSEVKGRHTTSAARLYHLPSGGDLIDSPGIREFSLSHLDPACTAMGFREFQVFLGRCRFRDCEHRDEPGCALRQAVAEGHVSTVRYRSYLQIIDDVRD